MIRNFLSTTITRLIIALINFGIAWISARYLGAEEFGTISLIVLSISIIQIATALLAGSSLVYQISRHAIGELLILSLGWIFLSAIPVWFILNLFNLIPEGYSLSILIVAVLGSIFTAIQNILLGQEKVQKFNAFAVLQSALVISSYAVMVGYSKDRNAQIFVNAQYISMTISVLLSIIPILPAIHSYKLPKWSLIIEALKFGSYLQTASLMQLFNYRFSYYLIEKYFDRATLGVFSLGVQIAESVWLIGKSMAVLLYSRISNSRDNNYSVKITISFIKITGMLTLFLTTFLALLPSEVFRLVFNDGFTNITAVISSLAPGIFALSVSLMFSHYFSGTGNPKHNTISSGIGLLITIVFGIILIPYLGYIGAGIVASVSYFTTMLYQFLVFTKLTHTGWRLFLPNISEIRELKAEIVKSLKH